MGRIFIALLLGTALLVLSQLVFGSGVLTRFWEVTSIVTSFGHTRELVAGEADAGADMGVVLRFIVEIFIYYLVAAILTFGIDLFLPKRKENRQ